MEKKVLRISRILTAGILLFVNVCLPVLVVGGILYFIFGR
jgi:hypothetical protein